ncbi:MAG: hypothetical protein PHT07_04560 [Paludibacter sp.]|nr:hypothetical protein [Paludibacter sp.]
MHHIDYKDLVSIVKQLPVSKLRKLNNAINKEIDQNKKSKGTDLKTLILNAPTWTDTEYNDYLSARENINKS